MRAGGCGLTAGTCELDHVVLVRQACADFAGAVRRLPQQEDAEGERAAHEFGEPRGPRLEAQTCAKDALYVGVDVVRCRRNGLANAPSPSPSCARTALSPWTACCRTWALWRAAATRGSPA